MTQQVARRVWALPCRTRGMAKKSCLALLLFAFCFTQLAEAAPGDITTVAGGGINDGAPATEAGLQGPWEVAVDSEGNLFIVDWTGRRIRRVDAQTNLISTVAGDGLYLGDKASSNQPLPQTGDLAIQARPVRAEGLAVDKEGSLYFGNVGLVKADRQGVLHRITEEPLVEFHQPYPELLLTVTAVVVDIALDRSENIYFSTDRSVRKVDAGTGQVTMVAGTGFIGFSGDGGPATEALVKARGICVDKAGNLYFTDDSNQRVRKIDVQTGIIQTIAGTGEAGFSGDGGPATLSRLYRPRGICMDDQGAILIADSFNDRVRKIDPSGEITTIAGTGEAGFSGDGGPATLAQLCVPVGLCMDADGILYIADRANQRVRMVDLSGLITTVAGGFIGDGEPATRASFNKVAAAILDIEGNLYVADKNNQLIRKVDAQTGLISTIAGGGTDPADGIPAAQSALDRPLALAFDGANNLFIAAGNRIRKLSPSGTIVTVAGTDAAGFAGDGGPATEALLSAPEGIFIDRTGHLYIADTQNHRVRKADAQTGIISTVAGTGEPAFSGDGWFATEAALHTPHHVFVDASGKLYISDGGNNRIRRVDTQTGVIRTLIEQRTDPRGIFVDDAGDLFFSEGSDGGRFISRIDPDTYSRTGTVTRVAGQGNKHYNGDGRPATDAMIYGIRGIFIDSQGNLYLTDHTNDRVRKVEAAAAPTALEPGVYRGPASTADPNTDFDHSGRIDFADFLLLAAQYGKTRADADFSAQIDLNDDGAVDFQDFLQFARDFGRALQSAD